MTPVQGNQIALMNIPKQIEGFENVEYINQVILFLRKKSHIVDSTSFATPVQYTIQSIPGHL